MQRKWQRRWLRIAKAMLTPVAVTSILLCSAGSVYALPTDTRTTSGAATISQTETTMTVNQTTASLVLSSRTFDIASGETVRIAQPTNLSTALWRVTGSDASSIYGNLTANGRVFLVNPNGILFAPGSQVDVGGLVASTLNITDGDFLAGNYKFSGDGGAVVNQGTITATGKGFVALLGGTAANEGVIVARQGSVVLGAGAQMTLDLAGDGLLGLAVDQAAVNALAANKGLIQADSGTVLMTARSANALAGTVLNNSGVIRARNVANVGGVIRLDGGTNGTVAVSGTLDASAPNGGNGGFIETSGASVKLDPGTVITAAAPSGKAGKWLLDPVDITVDAALATTLQSTLNGGTDAAVSTAVGNGGAGDITVAAPVAWSTANTLTLSADRNISIDAAITASGAGNLQLTAGGTIGASAAVSIGGQFNLAGGAWVQNAATLPAFHAGDFRISGGSFLRAAGGDGSAGSPYRLADIYGVQGAAIAGMLGKSYLLANNIDAAGTSLWNNGEGFVPIGSFSAPFTGTFDGGGHTISGLYIAPAMSDYVGMFGSTSGTIRNLGLADLTVNASGQNIGGLAGYMSGGSITGCYTSGTVNGSLRFIGGLVGTISGGSITDSYSASAVDGGFGGQAVGGLVGAMNGGSITRCYSLGTVNASRFAGGLVGYLNSGSITSSYWDTDSSFVFTGVGNNMAYDSYGLSTADMKNLATWTGASWNIDNAGGTDTVWRIYDGQSYPLLRSLLVPVTVTANNVSRTYDGTTYSGGGGVTYSVPSATLLGTLTYSGSSQGARNYNAAGYVITPGGYYSDQRGYDISYANGTLMINRAPLTATLTGTAAKTYDGSTAATLAAGNYGGLNGVVAGDTVSLVVATTGTYDNKNVGTGKTVTATGLSLSGADAGNYTVTASGNIGTVTARSLTVTATGTDKIYDGTVAAAVTYGDNRVAGDALTFTSTNTFGDKDIGTGKAVTVAGITLGGADAGNYTANASTATTADITRAPLTIRANNDTVTYNGSAYSGGNGVTYTGLVNGETAAVLGGTLTYGGTAQGATNAGRYTITPGGLTAGNYAITFVDGTLTIRSADTFNSAVQTAYRTTFVSLSRGLTLGGAGGGGQLFTIVGDGINTDGLKH